MTPAGAPAKVRRLCMQLPDAQETVSHGIPAFRITGGRMFAYVSHDHHGDGRTALLVKTAGREVAEHMITADPERLYSPPYVGVAGWIGMHLLRADTDWGEIDDRIEASWQLVAPQKLLKEREHG